MMDNIHLYITFATILILVSSIATLISNLTYINYCVWVKLNESTVEYIKQMRNISRNQFEFFDSMTEALLKSIDTGDKNNVVYLTGFLKGYESCRDDMVAKQKDEQVVEIKEPVAQPTKKELKYGDGNQSVSQMYM